MDMDVPMIRSGRGAHLIVKAVFFLLVTVSLIAAPAAAAEPPSNDNQAGATVLTLPADLEGTTVGATAAAGDPKCGAPMGATVWYTLKRPDDRTVVVSFQAHGELDVVSAAFQVVSTGLKTLVCVVSDTHGKAGFSFEGQKDATYLILIGQRANSVPGTFHLAVQAPPRPSNDDPAGAELLSRLPANPKGTTLGGSTDPQAPQCGTLSADVWYRVDRKEAGSMVVLLRAGGELDATLAIYRRVRSQLQRISCSQTDSKGRADLSINTEKDVRYLIAVGQLRQSSPGTFALQVFAPEPAAVGPGTKLVHGRARASVDALTDRDDAYSFAMEAGRTYRLNLVARGGCVGMALYPPGTRRFAEAESIRRTSCGGYMTFTPGPDAGGLYSIRVTPSGGTQGAQRYTLNVATAGPDDVGPGLELRNGETRRGELNGATIDVVDLYRFDVHRQSDVDLRLSGGVTAAVLSENGGRIATTQIRDRLRARLQPGRYFVSLRVAEPVKARYTLGLQIRDITTTVVSIDGSSAATIASPRSVSVTATVTPASASGGVVRLQIDYFDPLNGWVFVKQFKPRVVGTQATVSFLPTKIGRYRVHASFFGNSGASPSTSGTATLIVGPPPA
jgi:hypothetical protein